MKKINLVGLISITLVIVALLILGFLPTISDSTRHSILQKNGGSMDTASLDRLASYTLDFYRSFAYIMAAIGVGGILIATNKWINTGDDTVENVKMETRND